MEEAFIAASVLLLLEVSFKMISYLALMAYIIAFCHIAFFLVFGSRILKPLFNIFMGVGLAVNVSELFLSWSKTGNFPSSSLYDFMNIMSAAFVLTYFIIYAKYKRPLIGLFISPFNIIFSAAAIVAPSSVSYTFVDSVWRYGHLPFVILGSTFFIASFLAAVMYFIQERQLKGKKFGVVFQRFPPLDAINKINSATLKLGFYFFTIGAGLGFAWMADGGFESLLSSSKIIFSLATWVIFATIMGLQRSRGLPPRRVAFLTIAGFLCVLVTYIGVAAFLIR